MVAIKSVCIAGGAMFSNHAAARKIEAEARIAIVKEQEATKRAALLSELNCRK
jgi:hypothetical protein